MGVWSVERSNVGCGGDYFVYFFEILQKELMELLKSQPGSHLTLEEARADPEINDALEK